jgi:hypothetical protein
VWSCSPKCSSPSNHQFPSLCSNPSQLVIGSILLLAMLFISELFARLVDQGFVLSELGVVFVGFVDQLRKGLLHCPVLPFSSM